MFFFNLPLSFENVELESKLQISGYIRLDISK